MALAGELAKYIGNELVKTGGKELAKATASSTLSSLVPKVATDVATKTALGGIVPKVATDTASDGMMTLYRGLTQKYDPNYPVSKLDTSGYESWTDNKDLARKYGDNVYSIEVPKSDIKTSYLDEDPMSPTYGDRNPIYEIDKKAGLDGVSGKEYLLEVGSDYQKGLKYNPVDNDELNMAIRASGVDNGVATRAMHFLPKKNIPVETPQLPFVDMPKDMMANSMLQGEFHENPEIQQMRSLDELLGYDDFPKDRQELRTAVIDALVNRDTDDLTAKEILSQTPLLTRIFSNEQQLADQIGSGRLSSVSLASPSMLRYKDLVDFYGGDKPIITVLDVPEATRNGIYLDEGDLNTPTDFDKRRSVDEHNKLMEQYLDDYGIKKYDFGGFNDESWKEADWYMRTQNGRTSSGYAEGVADLGKNSIALRTNSIKRDDDMLNDLMDMIIEKARGENGREWLERIIPGSTEVLEKYLGAPAQSPWSNPYSG